MVATEKQKVDKRDSAAAIVPTHGLRVTRIQLVEIHRVPFDRRAEVMVTFTKPFQYAPVLSQLISRLSELLFMSAEQFDEMIFPGVAKSFCSFEPGADELLGDMQVARSWLKAANSKERFANDSPVFFEGILRQLDLIANNVEQNGKKTPKEYVPGFIKIGVVGIWLIDRILAGDFNNVSDGAAAADNVELPELLAHRLGLTAVGSVKESQGRVFESAFRSVLGSQNKLNAVAKIPREWVDMARHAFDEYPMLSQDTRAEKARDKIAAHLTEFGLKTPPSKTTILRRLGRRKK
jgi:hypothetical protein